MRYVLMHKDIAVASFDICNNDIREIRVHAHLPIGCTADMLPKWIYDRTVGCSNQFLKKWLRKNGYCTVHSLLQLTHSVSLNDCYWIKEYSADTKWSEISPYRNTYAELLSQVSLGSDARGWVYNRLCPDLSTSGTYPKCWKKHKDGIHLYKSGGQIYGSKGREPYCEVLAAQVYKKLKAGISYSLTEMYGKTVSKCKAFTSEATQFMPYNGMYSDAFSLTSVLYVYSGAPSEQMIRRMFIADAITCNVDRHSCNFGFLYSSEVQPYVMCAAPAFDYNRALLANCDFEDLDSTVEFANMVKSYYGLDFMDMARQCMTRDIRNDLVNLKGIELTLPRYDNCFTEQYAKWLTDIVNERIDEILKLTKTI